MSSPNASPTTAPSAAPNAVEGIFPLTPTQHGMLVHSDGPGRAYVEQLAFELEGPIDVPAFERAWNALVRRHPALRTSFVWKRGERPLQVVHREVRVAIERSDLPLEDLMIEERARGIDLQKAPLFRVVVSEGQAGHAICWTHHHMLLDGWSVPLLVRDLLMYYTCERSGTPIASDPLPPWQPALLRWLDQHPPAPALAYWTPELAETPPGAPIAELLLPEGAASGRALIERVLTAGETDEIVRSARDHGVTVATMVELAVHLTLRHLTGALDTTFGLTVSGRPPELSVESSVGLYIRTVPLRLRAAADTLLRDALRGLQEKVLAHSSFDTVPLTDLRALSGLGPEETWFDGVVVFENYPVDAIAGLSTADFRVKRAFASEETNYPWMLVVAPGPPLSMRLYAGQGLGQRAAERFLFRVVSALRCLSNALPGATMNLSLRTKEEIALALRWDGPSEPAFLSGTVVDALLARRAKDTGVWLIGPEGDATAKRNHHTKHDETAKLDSVIKRDSTAEHDQRAERDQIVKRDGHTFFERASRIAAALVARGVQRGDRVGVRVSRSVLQMESLLGIWLSGAAYVPLGEGTLPARRAQMIERCGLRVVQMDDVAFSEERENNGAKNSGKNGGEDGTKHTASAEKVVRSFEVLHVEDALTHAPLTEFRAPLRNEEAYVLFTSGSTGEPKGVSVSHGALWNLIASFTRDLGLSAATRLYAVTPITFDIAALEIWGALASGGLLGFGKEAERERPSDVVNAIATFKANVVQTTPSLWHAWLQTEESEKKLAGLVKLAGGEPLPRELALRLHRLRGELWNVYGPTETCIWSTVIRLQEADLREPQPSLGRPIANTQVRIVNAFGAELGAGECGEIVIGGAGLAQGYVNPKSGGDGIDNVLTGRAFRGAGETRVYHTGDQGYRNDEGLLFFEGRLDGQIKLRGVRLELGEIESAILSHPSVEAAAAVVIGAGVDATLHACFVRKPGGEPLDDKALETWVASRLAPGLRPLLTEIDRLPVSRHGKLDRAKLRAHVEGRGHGLQDLGQASANQEAEELLVSIVRDVLKHPVVKVTDDFFRIGGHSLLATQLTSRIRTALGVELPLRTVFEARTPRALAAAAMEMKRGGKLDPRPELVATQRAPREALSFAETRLWLVDRIAPGSAFYNIPAAVELLGPFDLPAMQSAIDQLVLRHESLRTTFHAEDGSPFACIHPSLPAEVRISAAENEAAMAPLAQAFLEAPFALHSGPLLRVLMISLSPERHALFLSVHHIVVDGWSMGIIVRELAELYSAALEERPHTLPALPIQYADYVAWQRAWLRPDSDRVRRALSYFGNELRHVPPLLLPTDRPRPPASRFRGTRVPFELSPNLTKQIDAFAEAERATTFMVLFAGFELLLARWSQQTEFAVGTPIAQRIDPKLEGLVGFFANTLAIRATVDRDATFVKLLALVRDRALSAYAHQDLPFERLVDELSPTRDLSRAPIFQAMFVLQNAPREELAGGGLVFRTLEPETGTAKLDVECIMHRNAAGILSGILVLDADLFERETAERVVEQWLHLLETVVADPKTPFGSLDLRTPKERAELAIFENGPRKDYGWQGGVVKAWLDRLGTLGPRVALVGPDDAPLTYDAFAEKVKSIGQALKKRGVQKGSRVGVCGERSVDLVAALHGIVAAGAAYVVLPPEMPKARLLQMRENAKVRWVLSDAAGERVMGEIAGAHAEIVRLEDVLRDPAPAFLPEAMGPEDPIYVLYTSGSTGIPKGVEGTHGGVWNRLMWQTECFGATDNDVVLQKTSMGFDVSVWEFFWPMLLGARLEVLREGEHRDPVSIVRRIRKREVSTVHFVPSMLRHFLEAEGISPLSSLRRIVCSGEALSVSDVERVRRLLPEVEIWNLYGPTEASVDVTFWKAPRDTGGLTEIPIGRPVANTACYVMDEAQMPVPLGASGELVLGGAQIALGYIGEELQSTKVSTTQESHAQPSAKFLPDRWSGENRGRVYRTGDRVRWNAKGQLCYEGRIDHQIKIRGQRVELGEIEAVIQSYPTVQSCTCILQGEGDLARLVAFVVQHEDAVAASQVADWGQVFKDTYRGGDGGEFAGWIDSLRDAPIPRAEMGVWVETTASRILALGGQRMFEVGCGTGLLAFPLAKAGRHYLGADIAPVEPLRAALSSAGLRHAEVLQAAAHEWPKTEAPDVIVLNSVAQYFPSRGYLTRWLDQAIRVVADGGAVFIGDVRHVGLQPVLARAIVRHHAPGELPAAELEDRVARLIEAERELLIDPTYFLEFARANPEVSEVQLLCKRGSFRNELNTFRYDVVLRVRGKSPSAKAWILDARESRLDLDAWFARAKSEGIGCVVHVPNARLSDPVWGGSHAAPVGLDPEEVMTRAEAAGVVVVVAPSPSDPFAIDLLFGHPAEPHNNSAHPYNVVQPHNAAHPYNAARAGTNLADTNLPARTLIDPASLREHISRALPEAWLPSELVALSVMPLGSSGKVDRKALSARRSVRKIEGASPEGDTEQLLARSFQDVLGLSSVARDVSFFDMGGHSLLAAKLASRLSRETGREIPLRSIFEAPTVAGLALKLGKTHGKDPSSSPGAALVESFAPETPSPLSFAQRRMYLLSALDEPSALYNIPIAIELSGPLDQERLRAAALRVVARQSALRTRLVRDPLGGEPRQILGPVEVEFAKQDAQNERSPTETEEAFFSRPFDLFKEAPIRFALIDHGENRYHLLIALHHLVADRWSLGVLAKELSEAYRNALENAGQKEAEREDAVSTLPKVDVRVLAARERQRGLGEDVEQALRAIESRLDGAPRVLPLPRGFVRPQVRSHRGERHAWHLPARVVDKLRPQIDPHRVTPFVLVTALFFAALSRLGFGDDFLLGTPLAGREDPEAAELIGLFVRTVVLRWKKRSSFLDQVIALREELLSAAEQSSVPFELVVEHLKADRDGSVEPLVQAMVVFQNTAPVDLHLPGVRARLLPAETGTSKFDLTLFAEAARGGWDLSLEYASDLFDREAMESLARLFDELADSVSKSFACDPAAVSLPWVHALSGDESPRPAPPTVVEAFLQVATQTPNAIAVEYGDARWTYAELSLAVHEAAAGLGSRDGEIIAVSLPRGSDLAVAILAILVSGAAYVALDPSGPPLRRAAILEDSRASICIGHESGMVSVGDLRGASSKGDDVDPNSAREATLPSASAPSGNAARKAAYVIYTSGSTGRPKGVVVSHGALANHMAWMKDAFGLQASDRVLQRTPLTFDASVWELFAPWWVGGTLVFAPDAGHADPEVLVEVLRNKRISIAQFVPTVLQLVVAEEGLSNLPNLRILCSGGEVLTRALADQVHAQTAAMLVNLYGPTETTIDACFFVVPRQSPEDVPVGVPIAGMRARVTDERGLLVPDGFPGELILSGAGLAEGYLGMPDESAKRFVTNFGQVPFGQVAVRSYRTGDIVRIRGGKLWFLGRSDGQVKIAGVRIELEEIEKIANRTVPVSAAIKREVLGVAEIVLFVEQSATFSERAMLDSLRGALPSAAVPRRVIQVEKLPRTTSGKLDRRALERIEIPVEEERPSSVHDQEMNGAERTLLVLCKKLLPAGEIDLETNLFAAGGDSMTVLSLVSEARKAGLRLGSRDVFAASSLRALARLCGASGEGSVLAGSVPERTKSHAPGSSGPLLPNMNWFFQLGLARPDHWNLSTLLELDECLDPDRLQRALDSVAARHEALHTQFSREKMTVMAPKAVPLLLESEDGTGDAQLQRLMEAAHTSVDLTSSRTLVAVLVLPPTGDTTGSQKAGEQKQKPESQRPTPAGQARTPAGQAPTGHGQSVVGLVAHHLVIDALGWPVLLDDLLRTYRDLPLSPPSASPLSLAEWINDLSLSKEELAFWQAQGGSDPSFARATERETTMTERVLPRAASSVLMNDVPRRAGVSREAVLLSAMVPSLLDALERSSLVLAMERHGRDVHDAWDFSHSLGWFTLLFPLRFDASALKGNHASMATIESLLRSIPRGGLGYGIASAQGKEVPALPDIAFNFFGRRPEAPAGVRARSVAADLRDPAGKRPFSLECEASIVDGELRVALVHAKQETRAERLLDAIVHALLAAAGETRGPRTAALSESAAALALRKLTGGKTKSSPEKGRGKP